MDPLSHDIHRPLKWEELQKGWNNLEKECEYWIPSADVIGEIPRELNGTFLRNGPGLDEIYGKKLKHRKYVFTLHDYNYSLSQCSYTLNRT